MKIPALGLILSSYRVKRSVLKNEINYDHCIHIYTHFEINLREFYIYIYVYRHDIFVYRKFEKIINNMIEILENHMFIL